MMAGLQAASTDTKRGTATSAAIIAAAAAASDMIRLFMAVLPLPAAADPDYGMAWPRAGHGVIAITWPAYLSAMWIGLPGVLVAVLIGITPDPGSSAPDPVVT